MSAVGLWCPTADIKDAASIAAGATWSITELWGPVGDFTGIDASSSVQ